jgi:hypothetical protein
LLINKKQSVAASTESVTNRHFPSPLATNDKSLFIALVQEKSQMSIFFYRKIKKLIHCQENHAKGLYKKERDSARTMQ